jgi:hypothetical protein
VSGLREAAGGAVLAAVVVLMATTTQADFTAASANAGNSFTAANLDSWTPVSASASRTGPTTCLVGWSPRASPPASLTYDVTDGAGATLASAVSGTSVSVTVGASVITPTVRARAGGWISAAQTTASTPCGSLPGAPAGLAATPSDAQIALTWTAPADDGGSAITSYTATAVPSDGTLPTRTCTGATTSCTITALTNGARYTITVTATTAIGTGSASNSVTAIAYPSGVMTSSALRLWLDGADPATMFQDTAATTPATAAGQTIARWNDKSGRTDGSGINYAQSAVSTEQPTLTTVNGHPVPTFDGTSDYLGLRSVSMLPVGTTTSTMVAVGTMTGSVGSDFQTLFQYGTGSTGASREIYKNWGDASDVVDAYVTGLVTDGTWSASPTISTGEFASANVRMWHAGRPVKSASGAFNTGTTFAEIGRETTNGRYWTGAVPELIVLDTTMADAQRRQVEEYLARKWNSAITPAAPTAVAATAGNAAASVSFTAPSWDGGSAITAYTVAAGPGPRTCTATPPVTSCTVTSLTNGTAYTFTVTATNAVGIGPASAPSATVTPITVPGAPTAVAATVADTTSSVSWTAPASTGGSAITSYTASAVPATGGLPTITCTTASSPCTLSGLVDGVTYTASVTATNAAGTGVASTSTTVVPIPAVMASANLKVWLDAQNAASLNSAVGCGGGNAATGSAVPCWKDRSASGWNAVRGSTSPVLTANAINGRQALRFVKTNPDYYAITSAGIGAVGSADRSVFAVTAARTTYGTDTTNNTNNAGFVAGWTTWNSGLLAKTSGASTTVDYFQADGYTSSGPTLVAAELSPSTNPAIAAVIYSSSAGTLTTGLALNGRGTLATGSVAGTWYTHGNSFWVGSAGSVAATSYAYPLDGDIGEVLVFNTALSAVQRRGVEEYLARRWVQTIAPAAPATASATAGTSTATVTFTGPAWDGGAPVSAYTVAPTSGAGSCTWTSGLTANCTGLTHGAVYTFTVRATTSAGSGPATTTAAVTP